MNARGTLALSILLLFLSSAGVSAWGPAAREQFCRKSVERVWGYEQMLECIPYGQYDNLVTRRIRTLYPLPETKRDYTQCPVTRGDDWKWVCGNKSQNPTGYLAEVWFNKSVDSLTICDRIINYCIGVDFHVNQYHPLHHTNHALSRYYDNFNEEVDRHVVSGDQDWVVEELVMFEYYEQLTGRSKKSRYQQKFTLYHSTYAAALDGVHETGLLIKARNFRKVVTTTLPRKPSITVKAAPKPATTTSIPLSLKPPAKTRQSQLPLAVALLLVVLLYAVYSLYRKTQEEPTKPVKIETNLYHIPGITGDVVEKLYSVGIDSIQRLMRTPYRKITERTGIVAGDLKALRAAQRKAFDEYFLVWCPLSMDDLTEKQSKKTIAHKNKINSMMAAYRDKTKISPVALADLEEIMRPLSEQERGHVQRIIDGKVDAKEDLPYRILATSAELDVGKIELTQE